ncbi:MAG: carboxypeptidase-like regulatory domain-containing protein, partial [Flavobacteriales bacterium]|nr:carboxypeptidase-like regulatory domain-containing protein [Flavobacteriales bacterium]
MKLRTLAFCGLFLTVLSSFGQTGTLTGTVVDDFSNEPIAIAAVTWEAGKGVLTDDEGNFTAQLSYGTYTLKISYAGYKPLETTVVIDKSEIRKSFRLVSLEFREVVVTGDIAVGRETPVAFSNIPLKRFEEELASRDVATIVNTTPGAYATQQGGGDGDAR